ncbi:MAG: P-loop NTPase [Planctomycetes bacterium]|nr:P-loop NTPase [Planctomycetota bacterium]
MSKQEESNDLAGLSVAIASGKGGTGKTTLATNMAFALATSPDFELPVTLLDCDVEEPNDHLFVRPEFTSTEKVSVQKPVWDAEKCTACGECVKHCNYNALALVKEKVLVFPELCHACGVCSFVCPENAMSEEPSPIGEVQIAENNEPFRFGHGLLDVGEPLAPAVVRGVKDHIDPEGINILDASPGTACPVVEAVGGTDVAILVTEPTPFGLNDLKLAVSLALDVDAPSGIVVNRSDGEDTLIAEYAEEVGVPIIGRIPFDRKYAETYSRGDLLAEAFPEIKQRVLDIFREATNLVDTTVPPVPELDVFSIAEGEPVDEPAEAKSGGWQECTVISGKGGTGKTTVAASLDMLAKDKIITDCDVDAADLHLLLHPRVIESQDFVGGIKATVNPDKCILCGQCAEACHFEAIIHQEGNGEPESFEVDDFLCEGCGLCPMVCPVDAIDSAQAVTGESYESRSDYGPVSHARLGIAEENTGKLVTRVRNNANDLAADFGASLVLSDGSPGTGCPVIASISGVDLVLIVTEPTLSGVHDMERVFQLCQHFGVKALVAINKCDLNAEQVDIIHQHCENFGSRVIGEIPFDSEVNDALMAGKTVVQYSDGPAAKAIKSLWTELKEELHQ